MLDTSKHSVTRSVELSRCHLMQMNQMGDPHHAIHCLANFTCTLSTHTSSKIAQHCSCNAAGAPFRSEHARQRRLEKRNAHRQKIRQRFVEVAAKQLAKKQLARVRLLARWHLTPSITESVGPRQDKTAYKTHIFFCCRAVRRRSMSVLSGRKVLRSQMGSASRLDLKCGCLRGSCLQRLQHDTPQHAC